MGKDVRIQELPGIGKKYDLTTDDEQRLAVIAHRDGRRELYAFAAGEDEPAVTVALSEKQARLLSAVLAGTYFTE